MRVFLLGLFLIPLCLVGCERKPNVNDPQQKNVRPTIVLPPYVPNIDIKINPPSNPGIDIQINPNPKELK